MEESRNCQNHGNLYTGGKGVVVPHVHWATNFGLGYLALAKISYKFADSWLTTAETFLCIYRDFPATIISGEMLN